ncbi:MAG: hypothetical protein ACRCVT_05040 [Leadbetterella sp.]
MKSFRLIKLTVTTAFTIFCICQSYCQNEASYESKSRSSRTTALKGFIETSNNKFNQLYTSDTLTSRYKDKSWGFFPRFALVRKKENGSYFQCGLSGISYSKNEDAKDYRLNNSRNYSYYSTGFAINVFTEWFKSIKYDDVRKNNFFLGIGLKESFEKYKYGRSDILGSYELKKNIIGLEIEIIPNWQYSISDNCQIDVSLPYYIITSSFGNTYNNQPAISTSLYKTPLFDFDYLPKNINLRIGLAVQF